MTQKHSQTVAHVLGEMVWMLSQSAPARPYTIADLEWMIMPAILLKQFQIFYKDEKAVGFAVWANLSDEIERKLRADFSDAALKKLDLNAWKSGDRPWLLQLVSPYDRAESQIIDKLRDQLSTTVFNGKSFHYFTTHFQTGERQLQHQQATELSQPTATVN